MGVIVMEVDADDAVASVDVIPAASVGGDEDADDSE